MRGHVEIENLAIRHVKFWTHSSCSWSARSSLILLVSSNHTLKRQCWEHLQIFIGAYQSCPRLGSRVRTELFRQSEGPSVWSLNCLSVGRYGNSTFRSHCIVQISAARRIPLKRWSVAKCLGKASTPVCHLIFTSFPGSYQIVNFVTCGSPGFCIWRGVEIWGKSSESWQGQLVSLLEVNPGTFSLQHLGTQPGFRKVNLLTYSVLHFLIIVRAKISLSLNQSHSENILS